MPHFAERDRAAPPLVTQQRVNSQLVRPFRDGGWRSWVAPLAVAALAGFIRFYHLGEPRVFAFDETYYAKDAFSLLRFGYEREFVDGANEKILSGNLNVFKDSPEFVVHPPLGKWIIAVGEQVFGMTPFGWRFSVALLGTLSVLILARVVRRMTRSTLVGTIAGLLLALDGLHVVMSRTALLDLPLSFFVLAAFAALVLDRDQVRARAATRLDSFYDASFGGRLGFRPWLVAAGLLLGAACAVKWNGLWFLLAFTGLALYWNVSLRRASGVRHPWVGTVMRDGLPALAALILTAVTVYLSSWSGWLASDSAYGRQWAAQNAHPFSFVPDALVSLVKYNLDAYRFHVGLTSPHAYQSQPAGWLVLARPVSFFFASPGKGVDGCTVDKCAQEVLALGNPVLWWGSVLALALMAWLAVSRLDWRPAAALVGVGAGWLPWFNYANRTMFSFYATAFAPFVAMAVALALAWTLGPAGSSPRRRTWGAAVVGAYLVAVIGAFVAMYPLYVAQTIPYSQWWDRLLHWQFWV